MITPFTGDDKPDFQAMEKMVQWYIDKGCSGIFAVCQSSEMFFLTPQEKLDIAECVKNAAAGRIAIVASGHTADSLDEQKREIADMALVGLDAIVLVSNRLAKEGDPDSVFMKNVRSIYDEFPGIAFGMYECPYPYKRLVSLDFLRQCVDGSGGSFLKDTCCDPEIERSRAEVLRGSGVGIYNANTATLLSSLIAGYTGYNGIMANYHPELYVWLVANHRAHPEEAKRLSDLLTVLAMSEGHGYPVSAKYHFDKCAVPMTLRTRSVDPAAWFTVNDRLGIDSLIGVEREAEERFLGDQRFGHRATTNRNSELQLRNA
jgi:4-hydroxy-tetrahydrodipicolinate synthase